MEVCFICGNFLKKKRLLVVDTKTTKGTSLPSLLGSLIEEEFVVVISHYDEICLKCFKLLEEFDELAHKLAEIKNAILNSLRYNYSKDNFNTVSEEDKTIVSTDSYPVNCGSDSRSSEPIIGSEIPINKRTLTEVTNSEFAGNKNKKVCSIVSDKTKGDCDLLNLDQIKMDQSVIQEETKKVTSDAKQLIPDLGHSKCGLKEISVNDMDYQANKNSPQKPLNCNICEMPFLKSTTLADHLKAHEQNNGPAICSICDLKCHDDLHLHYHNEINHNINSQIPCISCDEKFYSIKDLKNHLVLMHNSIDNFKCGDCGITFKRRLQLANHKLYEHGNHECRFCKKYIVNPKKLRQHEQRHVQLDMKKFDCKECGRNFKTPGGLRVHKVSHTGKYNYFCEFCGRGFVSPVTFEQHKGTHTQEKRFICDLCGRKFVHNSTLHQHQLWHQSPYPFACKLCDEKFKYRGDRADHFKKIHLGQNLYKCSICSAVFHKASNLKRHSSFHNKNQEYICEICKKCFYQRRSLTKHLARMHKDNNVSNVKKEKCQYKVVLHPEEYPTVGDSNIVKDQIHLGEAYILIKSHQIVEPFIILHD